MVFFNYSTMQMAAKIVYYGPGLCGKTTNLQYIYSRTAKESRGEMVSLETETDRTLFFDLLPIDVGSISGFQTRVQLYTVPGQVFYNTTRKLVLKGVDGIVFVADSQRPMLQANIDSFKNLEENLAEMGLSVDEVPLVLQYNKRDLQDISSLEELNQALNRNDWQYFPAEAINGKGVFEALKAISKLTLVNLKKRLASGGRPGAASSQARAATAPPAAASQPPAPTAAAAAQSTPIPSPSSREPRAVSPSESRTASDRAATSTSGATGKRPRRSRSKSDVLAELERIREQTLAGGSPPRRPRQTTAINGRKEINREIQLTLTRDDFERVRRFLLSLQVEDGERQIVDAVRDFQVDIGELESDQNLLLRLDIALRSKE